MDTEVMVPQTERKSLPPELLPYIHSQAVENMLRAWHDQENIPLAERKIVFTITDLDSTIGEPVMLVTNEADRAKRDESHRLTNEAAALIRAGSDVFVTSTARTSEMVITSDQYALSPDISNHRPPPKMGKIEVPIPGDDKKKKEIRTDETPEAMEPAGILNADIVNGASGADMFVHQKNNEGYMADRAYQQETDYETWRASIEKLIHFLQKEEHIPIDYIDIEVEKGRYERGENDVAPGNLRSVINFKNNIEAKAAFLRKLRHIQRDILDSTQAQSEILNRLKTSGLTEEMLQDIVNLNITDDSNPEKGVNALYLTPHRTDKARASFTMMDQLIRAANWRLQEEHAELINANNCQVNFVGDGWLDLKNGLYGGSALAFEMDVTYVIPDNSRLIRPLTDPTIYDFGGNSLSAIKNHLHQIGKSNEYVFETPRVNGPDGKRLPKKLIKVVMGEPPPLPSKQGEREAIKPDYRKVVINHFRKRQIG